MIHYKILETAQRKTRKSIFTDQIFTGEKNPKILLCWAMIEEKAQSTHVRYAIYITNINQLTYSRR